MSLCSASIMAKNKLALSCSGKVNAGTDGMRYCGTASLNGARRRSRIHMGAPPWRLGRSTSDPRRPTGCHGESRSPQGVSVPARASLPLRSLAHRLLIRWTRLPVFRQPEKYYGHYAATGLSFLLAMHYPALTSPASVHVAMEPGPLVMVEAQDTHCPATRATYVSVERVVLHGRFELHCGHGRHMASPRFTIAIPQPSSPRRRRCTTGHRHFPHW